MIFISPLLDRAWPSLVWMIYCSVIPVLVEYQSVLCHTHHARVPHGRGPWKHQTHKIQASVLQVVDCFSRKLSLIILFKGQSECPCCVLYSATAWGIFLTTPHCNWLSLFCIFNKRKLPWGRDSFLYKGLFSLIFLAPRRVCGKGLCPLYLLKE